MNHHPTDHGKIVLAQPAEITASSGQLAHTQMPAQTHTVHASLPYAGVQRTVFSVEEIIGYIRKYWILATLIGVLSAVGIFTYVQSRQPVFESTAVVLLHQSSGKQLNLQTMEPDVQSEYNLPQLVNNLKIKIESDKFRLSLYQAISPELRERIIGEFSEGEQGQTEEVIFLERLAGIISIDVLKDSHMISITAKASDKDMAADVANAYVNHFSEYAKDQEMEMTRKVVAFLGSKAEELLARVKVQEKDLLEFRKNGGVVSIQEGSDFVADKITVLNTQLVDARLQEEKLRDVILAVDGVGTDPEEILKVPALAENHLLEKAYAQLAESRAHVATLSTDYGRKHPTMIVAVSQQESAYDNLQKLVGQTVGSLRRQLSTSIAKVGSLEIKVREAKGEMVAAGNKSVSQELIEQQLKASRDLYNSLILQMNEANISLQFAGVDRVRITEKAMARRTPVFPSKPLSAVLASVAFAGCFFGIPLTLGFGQRLLELGKMDEGNENDSLTDRPVDPANSLEYHPDQAAGSIPVQSSFPANYGASSGGFSTIASFPALHGNEPREWVRAVANPATQSGTDLSHFVSQSLRGDTPTRGLIITSERTNSAKTLTAAAVCLAANHQGLSTLLVSSENLVPSIEPRLRKEKYASSDGRQLKSTEELLYPFTTDEKNLYFITDDAWKRIPVLCLETLCNALHCVDLLVLDAPLLADDSSLKIMSSFATKSILVRGESEGYDFLDLQSKFHRAMPDCPVAGEFMISG